MTPKKQKAKDRRRARKLAEEAWEAVAEGNLDLAEKIIRRAVTAQIDNPVLWTDQGSVLQLREKDAEAAEAFRAAVSLAPTFAEPYDKLAALRIRQGYAREAVQLQTEAVKHAPENQLYAERLEAYRALAGKSNAPAKEEPEQVPEPGPVALQNQWTGRVAQLDWQRLGEQLTSAGCVLLPTLVDEPTCRQLRDMFGVDAYFGKTVVMDRPEFGLGAYRYFRAPIPEAVDQLRRAVYPHVARIASDWHARLQEATRYPADWEDFRAECAEAGQTTPTPILLRYGPGGFNALHRDLRGSVFFPIQMAVVLSPRSQPSARLGDGFRGGNFLLCDVPEGKKSRRREMPAGLGDAILFCTRDRLVEIGGAYGLQPVKHGVAMIEAGERYVLGVPFHEYR